MGFGELAIVLCTLVSAGIGINLQKNVAESRKDTELEK